MAEFRTIVNIESDFRISYRDRVLMLGSCFTDNIGQRLAQAKIPVTINPYGVLFNPESIAATIENGLNNKIIEESDLLLNGDLWVNLDFHGSFSSTDKNEALAKMNLASQTLNKKLSEATILFLTFGTAYVYKHLQTNKIVANCHKLPGTSFQCFMLKPEEIADRYTRLIDKMLKLNPNLQIVFTVSPIRHLRDGLHRNQLSKASLLLAIEQIISRFQQAHYFPSYEILLDDLRDYRFYDTDMVHPSSLAIDYIWQQLRNSCISPADNQLIDEITKIETAVNHKPINPQSTEFQKFASAQIDNIKKIAQVHPNLDFSAEIKHFEQYVKN